MTMRPMAPEIDQQITRALADTVQVTPSVSKDGAIQGGFGSNALRGPYLPAWGTRQREFALRDLYRSDEGGLIAGSFTGITKTVASLGWEITGDEEEEESSVYASLAQARGWRLRQNTGVEYFQEVFRQANFGKGWGSLITQWMNDFLRYDAGGYIEVIASGDSYDRPLGEVTGLAHLDPLHCYPTGDPLYPAVYYDRYGGIHVLHHSRVIRMVDMEDGDDTRPGYGRSALSRAVPVAMQEIWMTRYITARLDDKPPPGLTLIGGITRPEWEKTDQQYLNQQGMDTGSMWGRRKFYFAPDMGVMPKVESYEFSTPPENFDYREYTDINVDRLANAIGVDRQELMQLMGGNIGSGAQSVVLDQKSRGKCIGFFIQEVERQLNDILPDGYTFQFKQRNGQESIEAANEAKAWAGVAKETEGSLSADERRTMLSNAVPEIQEAIKNTPRVNDVFNQPFTAEDNTSGAVPLAQPASTVSQAQTQPFGTKTVEKAYIDTEAAFVQDMTDLIMSASTPNPYLDRRAFTVTLRSFLRNYGLQAYKDGMAQGGVSVDTLDTEDMNDYMRVFVEQSQYINGLADDIYKSQSISPATAPTRAYMWTKSLQAFADSGTMAANKNAMYRWELGMAEHCADCLRLSGQVHRIRNWKARGWLPRVSKLACKGFNCRCKLVRTTERAKGGF